MPRYYRTLWIEEHHFPIILRVDDNVFQPSHFNPIQPHRRNKSKKEKKENNKKKENERNNEHIFLFPFLVKLIERFERIVSPLYLSEVKYLS